MLRVLQRSAYPGGKYVLVAMVLAGLSLIGLPRTTAVHAGAAPTAIVVADAVLGGGPADPPGQSCTIRSQFPQGASIIFRVKVIDPATGAAFDNTQVASVAITLPDGTTQNYVYGSHPPGPNGGLDAYWVYAFHIPTNYPTGAFTYTVTVTDLDGNTVAPVGFNDGIPDVMIVPAGQF